MVRATVMVKDNRCSSGLNVRVKMVKNIDEAIKWGNTVKNRYHNYVTVLDQGLVTRHT